MSNSEGECYFDYVFWFVCFHGRMEQHRSLSQLSQYGIVALVLSWNEKGITNRNCRGVCCNCGHNRRKVTGIQSLKTTKVTTLLLMQCGLEKPVAQNTDHLLLLLHCSGNWINLQMLERLLWTALHIILHNKRQYRNTQSIVICMLDWYDNDSLFSF